MILYDNFFKQTGAREINSDGTWSASVVLNPEHYIYKAHFPNRPITPGVCILQMADELLERALGTKLCIQTVENAKFLSLLVPQKNLPVKFSFSTSPTVGGLIRMQCDVTEENALIAKLQITYTADD